MPFITKRIPLIAHFALKVIKTDAMALIIKTKKAR